MWQLFTDADAIPEFVRWILRFAAVLVFFGTLAWHAEKADRRWLAAQEGKTDDDTDLRDLRPRHGD